MGEFRQVRRDRGNASPKNRKGCPPLIFRRAAPSNHFFKICDRITYLTFSLRFLPALNLTTFEAGISIFSPVRGFRPSR